MICAGIEPQKDGIGDYTRTLANQLSNYYCVILCAINDDFVSEMCVEFDTNKTVRLSSSSSWGIRAHQLSQLLQKHQPIWISYQLAPFGFHKKGIIYKAAKHLIPVLKSYKIHFFVHELWLGAEKGASIKKKIWGIWIKFFLVRMIKKLRPQKVYVSCAINKFLLEKEAISCEVIPIFSNINIDPTVDLSLLEKNISLKSDIKFELKQTNFLVIGFFGMIHPYWNPIEIFTLLEHFAKVNKKQLLFIFIGKIDKSVLEKVIKELPSGSHAYTTGIVSNSDISGYIQLCQLGITSNPEIMLGKSGTVASFLEHQKPVVVYKNNIEVSSFELPSPISSLIIYPEKLSNYLLNPKKDSIDEIRWNPFLVAEKMKLDMEQ